DLHTYYIEPTDVSESRAEQNQKVSLVRGTDVDGTRHEAVCLRIEVRDRHEFVGKIIRSDQHVAGGNASAIRVGGEKGWCIPIDTRDAAWRGSIGSNDSERGRPLDHPYRKQKVDLHRRDREERCRAFDTSLVYSDRSARER